MTSTTTMNEPQAHEPYEDPEGLAIRCTCGSWAMLHRNHLGRTAEVGFREHVAKAAALEEVAAALRDRL